MQEFSPVHTNITRVINIKNGFFLSFFSFCPSGGTGGRTRQVCNSAWAVWVLWAPWGRGAPGRVVLALPRQEQCFCACLEAGGRFMARSLRQHSFLGHSGPQREKPRQGGTGLGKPSYSCCVWFPFGPRDLDKRAAFIDWGEWGREEAVEASLWLFVFLSKHLLSIYCVPGIMLNAFHVLSV